MAITYSVLLSRIIQEFDLEMSYMPSEGEKTKITAIDVTRPALPLTGYYDMFHSQRIQLIGLTEMSYMDKLSSEIAELRYDEFFSKKPPVVILANGIIPNELVSQAARTYSVPLLTTTEKTSQFMANLVAFLNGELAPRITRHGVLLEVHGEGVLLLGESGVGKSETAIELVKRGHRLIADDAVEIRKISNRMLVGTSPENIRHFMELRGVGIINARNIFGIGAVKIAQKINFVVQLEVWEDQKVYDRMGLDDEFVEILGIKIKSTTIPVKPGRNLAIIIEVAAMNNRQKEMGYNATHELLKRLGMMEEEPNGPKLDWNTY